MSVPECLLTCFSLLQRSVFFFFCLSVSFSLQLLDPINGLGALSDQEMTLFPLMSWVYVRETVAVLLNTKLLKKISKKLATPEKQLFYECLQMSSLEDS